MTRRLPLQAAGYVRHPLHETERIWTETNCYVDLWVELLHALGLDPVAGCAFTLATDFEGDQWGFFKFPPEDLRRLYGVEVQEMNVWRPLLEHAVEQLELGRLLTVEVDAWYLPDTAGVSYRSQHTKTTIVPNEIDVTRRRLGYFHNASYFELEGDDFDGALRVGAAPESLVPYVELVKLERLHETSPEDVRALAAEHLARRPADNPMTRFRKRLEQDLPLLAERDLAWFHEYAFGTARQCGANFELAATFVDWLGGPDPATQGFRRIAESAKALQFSLARAARGRSVDIISVLTDMERDWDDAMAALDADHGA